MSETWKKNASETKPSVIRSLHPSYHNRQSSFFDALGQTQAVIPQIQDVIKQIQVINVIKFKLIHFAVKSERGTYTCTGYLSGLVAIKMASCPSIL